MPSRAAATPERAACVWRWTAPAASMRRLIAAPEAAALANWLRQNAAAFGLPDTAIPDDDPPRRSRRRGVPMPDWRKIGSALTSAEGAVPDNTNALADRWIEAIA